MSTRKIIASLLFLTLILTLMFSSFSPAYSAYLGSGNPKDNNFQLVPCKGIDCDFNALLTLINRIITFILYISIPLAAISFSYAGYLYISAVGNTSQIEKAHEIFKKVGIGFIFIASGWLIVYTITNALLSSDFKDSKANLLQDSGGSNNNGSGGSDTSSENVGDINGSIAI